MEATVIAPLRLQGQAAWPDPLAKVCVSAAISATYYNFSTARSLALLLRGFSTTSSADARKGLLEISRTVGSIRDSYSGPAQSQLLINSNQDQKAKTAKVVIIRVVQFHFR